MVPAEPGDPPRLDGLGICIVGINYFPDTTGIAPYNRAIAMALTAAGAHVHVVTGVPHYPEWRVKDDAYLRGSRWEETLDGIRVTRVRHHVPQKTNLVGRARMEESFLARAIPVVRADRSDIVIAVTPSLAGLAAGVLGARSRPVGVHVQDLTGNAAGESGTTGGRASRAIAGFEYSLMRRANLVGVITPQFADILVEHGIRPDRIVDLPNFTHIVPVDADAASARARLGWSSDRFTVVHTGNMGMKQGLEHVVEAARLSEKSDRPIDFVLVGDGNQREQLVELGAGISTLRFVDPLDGDEYPYALAAADALLLHERPGVREMSLPSKLTSYSRANRPIIAATEPGGITHRVVSDDRAALIVEPGSPAALVAAAQHLRDDEARRRELADAATAMHEARYAAEAAFARYVEFADRLRSAS